MQFDCVIVGGGIAGLQAAIQLGRYGYQIAVIDAGEGRSTLCKSYHNLIGFPDGVSGAELLASGKEQAKRLGVTFIKGWVTDAARIDNNWSITIANDRQLQGRTMLLATGVKDRIPNFPMLIPCMGISVFVCPDCDGYEIMNKPALVIGAGNAGARMALTLTHWTGDIIYVNHDGTSIEPHVRAELEAKEISCIQLPISEILAAGEQFKGIILDDGSVINRSHCFVAFGGNEVRSSLARQLGADLTENNHIKVDPRTKLTSVNHLWAAGDVTAHSEMVTIAMGDGSQAAVWIHKSLSTIEK
ncbi:NAD(P)/FAD-dependent oxidoreductase [Paenibacillus sinopodophylli]|uniref:NAD(P)/FAD-dependent oxidoreductase n=1 Tax=Paenibacillus sinopodophylli TaxID=1837342 RepID=UPI00110CFE38|nr:NAD(P)/FAD-dependent oxidoreductase [Paenibacillus sinopodophylli]